MKNLEPRTVIIESEAETRELGLEIASKAEPGDVIALIGDLGTGKTTLTRYIAEGLGITSTISSPTFTIVKEYKSGRMPLYHFDVYRLGDSEEFLDIGAEEYLNGNGLCVIEWADIVADVLPEDTILIHIQCCNNGSDPNCKTATTGQTQVARLQLGSDPNKQFCNDGSDPNKQLEEANVHFGSGNNRKIWIGSSH